MKISLEHKNRIYIPAILIVVALFSLFGNLEKYSPSKEMGFKKIMPVETDGWKLVRTSTKTGVEGFVSINEMFQGVYYHPVYGYMGITLEYSSDSRRRHELHFPDICQEARGDKVVKFPSFHVALNNGNTLPVALLSWEYRLKSQKALCAYWYVVNGEPSISTLSLKIKQIFAGLFNKPKDSVLVRIDRFYEKALTEDRLEKKIVLLKKFIKDLYSGMKGNTRSILYGS
jgi:hypothetical protein